MATLPACCVRLRDSDGEFACALSHYEMLKDMLDNGAMGWVELNHAQGSGRLLCRVEDIYYVFLAPPDYAAERDDWIQENQIR